ncbi:UNVERIFIED_CONTAM: hypothetical protein FKN15_017525, partial [Acipenser sinensis]
SLQEMQRMPEAIQYIEKASMMYVENGTPDTAAMALDRAGKMKIVYGRRWNYWEKPPDYRFDEAAASIQKEKNIYKDIENYPTCFKKTIAQVLVHLHRNDFVAADRCVRESYRSVSCCTRIVTKPRPMFLQYAKLALSLKVPGGGTKKKSPETPKNGDGGSRVEQDDDEYSGGLC